MLLEKAKQDPEPLEGLRPYPGTASSGVPAFEFSLDPDWRITDITADAAAWCGSAGHELIGCDSREVWAPPQKPVAEAMAAAFASGATTTLEQPSLVAPGRRVRIEIAPSQGGVRFRFEDITAGLTEARGLQQSEHAGSYSLSAGPTEIAILDAKGAIVAVNAAWRSAMAAHCRDIADGGLGMAYVDVCKAAWPDLDKQALRTQLKPLLMGRLPNLKATWGLETPLGRELRQVHIAPFQDTGATRFMAIHEDTTEHARILAELDDTSDQLLHAQERERRRIAIELHDSTSQLLAGLILGLHNLKRTLAGNEPAKQRLDELAELAQDANREIRVLSFLMNASGGREGLQASVGRFVEGFARRTGLEVTFRSDGPTDDISEETQHAVFRIVQEALSNIYRHAGATKASVTVVREGEVLTAHIADNGEGFGCSPEGDAETPPLGVGIPGMRARIEQLGGVLELATGQWGTTVTATVPVGIANLPLRGAGVETHA
jgi:signal transduction histidine kinase